MRRAAARRLKRARHSLRPWRDQGPARAPRAMRATAARLPVRIRQADDDHQDDGTEQISIGLSLETCSRRYGHNATHWISLRGGGCRSTRTATPAIGGLDQ